MASIKDVARRAGVSIATVSRVLADKPHVRPELQQLVLTAVEELDYRPNRVASNLRRQTSSMIGLLVSDIRNPFFTAVARAIEDEANLRHMNVFLCNTDEDPHKERRYLEMLLAENVAGIILSPTEEALSAFQFLIDSETPFVTIDRRIQNAAVDSVVTDNIQAAQQLTEHLLLQGYRRIVAVIGLQNSTTGRERMLGYRQALLAHGGVVEPEFAAYVQPREWQGYEFVKALLQQSPKPEAILTGNSRLTVGAIKAIFEAGLRIPEDIALAGFDETNWMPYLGGTGVTVVDQPTYEMGKTAAELLFLRINDSKRPVREVVLKSKLIVRGSTGER